MNAMLKYKEGDLWKWIFNISTVDTMYGEIDGNTLYIKYTIGNKKDKISLALKEEAYLMNSNGQTIQTLIENEEIKRRKQNKK